MIPEYVGLILLGGTVAAYGTLIGAGGGFVLVPVLIILYPDLEPEHVTAISLAVVWANSTSGSAAYARHGRIDYVSGLLFAAASGPAVVAGALTVHFVHGALFSGMFSLILLALAVLSFRNRVPRIRGPESGPGILVRDLVDGEGRHFRYAYRLLYAIPLSVAVGFVSSFFGIGGGIIHVPAMIMWLHFPIEFAVPTSQFILTFMAGGGSVVHLLDGSLAGEQLVRALTLAIGAVPGAQLGAHFARGPIGKKTLPLLAFGLGLLGIRLLIRTITGV